MAIYCLILKSTQNISGAAISEIRKLKDSLGLQKEIDAYENLH